MEKGCTGSEEFSLALVAEGGNGAEKGGHAIVFPARCEEKRNRSAPCPFLRCQVQMRVHWNQCRRAGATCTVLYAG